MPTTLDLTGLDRLTTRFKRLINPDASPLMLTWTRIIDDDNRKGVLAGTDKNGNLMVPVTYRPKGQVQKKLTNAQRNTNNRRAKRGEYAGLGPHAAGLHNNLTAAEYRLLDGPPLAPRRAFSRVITNLLTRFGQTSIGVWEAVGYWDQVVSTKGVKFLQYHFNGAKLKGGGWLWKRDLRGVRPEGMEKARKAARNWMLDMVRSNGA